jgi:hypothetical protein
MTLTSTSPSSQTQVMLRSLQDAVEKSLDRKRRLGQYAVTWHNGQPVLTGTDKPEIVQQPVGQSNHHRDSVSDD